jgi:hypothetical protein
VVDSNSTADRELTGPGGCILRSREDGKCVLETHAGTRALLGAASIALFLPKNRRGIAPSWFVYRARSLTRCALERD